MPNTNEQLSRDQQIAALEKDWASNSRWKGVKRGSVSYTHLTLPTSDLV